MVAATADTQSPLARIRPQRYCGAGDPGDPALADCLISGSLNYFWQGRKARIWSGLLIQNAVTGSRALFNVSDVYAGLGDGATDGIGSVFSSIARAIFFVGQGDLRISGGAVRAAASTIMQLILYRSGSYSGAGTGSFQVGLAQPSAPTVAARAPSGGSFTGKLSGTYSIVLTRVRSATGAESKASTSSAIISADQQSVRATIPAASSNGDDRWGFYVTKAGFGSAGPHYFHREIAESDIQRTVTDGVTTNASPTITSATAAFTASDVGKHVTGAGIPANTTISAYVSPTQVTLSANATATAAGVSLTFTAYLDSIDRSIELEWNDGDLFPIFAPLDNDPPPACVFGLGLEDVVLGVGAYGDVVSGIGAGTPGTCVVISLPLYPEAFPADNEHILFLPGVPTGVSTRSARNYAFIYGGEYLCALTYTGGTPAVTLQLLWPTTGFQYEHNVCIAEDELFGYIRGRGAVRLGAGDEPDTSFALDVSDDLATFTTVGTFTGYDAETQLVAFACGQRIHCWNRQLESWGTPFDASTILSANEVFCGRVMVGNQLLLATRDTVNTAAALKLWKLHGGAGTTGVAILPWQDADAPGDLKEIFGVDASMRCDTVAHNVQIDAYAVTGAIKTTAPSETLVYTPVDTGPQDLPRWRPCLPAGKRFTFKVTYTSAGGDAGLFEIVPRGVLSGVPI